MNSKLVLTQGERFCLVTAVLKRAGALAPQDFQQQTTALYAQVRQALASSPTPHPVRFWNCLPAIHLPTGEAKTRYMDFNAGRFAAFEQWFGGAERFGQAVPSASAVGYEGNALTIHCLGSATPGRAVTNPRQVAPYRYSRRFGPLPPCFARATVVQRNGKPRMILVGGTASIVGEDSVHFHSLGEQIAETFENLACLAAAACNEPYGGGPTDRARWLARYRELRVYYPNTADQDPIRAAIETAFPQVSAVEFVRAELCRPELLVEIEGLAEDPIR